MTNKVLKNILLFFLLTILQVLIVKNLNFGVYFIMLPYVLFILSLPFETPRLLVLLISFVGGLILDMFYNTPGLHASACTAMGFARYYVLKYISPREGYDPAVEPSVEDMGAEWFIKYASVLIITHHFLFFFLEVFSFSEFFRTLFKIILSVIGTFAFVYLIQFLFFNRKIK
jgi:hypothetical protein